MRLLGLLREPQEDLLLHLDLEMPSLELDVSVHRLEEIFVGCQAMRVPESPRFLLGSEVLRNRISALIAVFYSTSSPTCPCREPRSVTRFYCSSS